MGDICVGAGFQVLSFETVRRHGVPTRVYVSYGADRFQYWRRRLAETRGS